MTKPTGRKPGKAPRWRPATRTYGLDLVKCWQQLRKRVYDATGLDIDQEMRQAGEPVARARRGADVASATAMRTLLALTQGASAADLETDKSGARLMIEGSRAVLSIVGLRAGDVLEHDFSDRFKDALSAFYGPPTAALEPAPAALPPDPDEPARRRRTPAAGDRDPA